MLEPDGSPNTAHSMNPVPLIVTADVGELREGGILADVAPTVLALMGQEQPPEMTGKPLLGSRGVAAPAFTIDARATATRARGLIHTPHGDVRTPAFVPLASTATVKSLHAAEVAELGYDMVLGNTFHLFIQPGPDLIAELGGLHEFMGWKGAIITDSGGYQVFSMGHGSVAEEIKRSRDPRASRILAIEEEGVRFRSYLDGGERFMGPETSMEVQAKLGSDIALAFDECTPFHVERDYTERSMERTHRWLDRCVAWHARARARRPAPLRDRAGRRPRGPARPVDRLRRRRGRPGDRDRRLARPDEGADARGGRLVAARPARRAAAPPARHRRRGRPGPRGRRGHRHLRLRDPDPARPPRHRARPRPGGPLAARPGQGRAPLAAASRSTRDCPCPACREHTRAYLHYLVRAGELTAKRLLTLHNLTFMERLMRGLREAIEAGTLAEHGERVLAGAAVR